MAIDPSIPLSVRTADFSQGIGLLTRGIEQKRERGFRQKQFEANEKTAGLQRQQILQQIAQNNKTFSLNEAAEDFVNFNVLVENNDIDGLRQAVNNRLEKLKKRAEKDPTVNLVNTQRLADVLNQNPAAAGQVIKNQLMGFADLGLIQRGEKGGLASAKTEIFKNGAVIQALPSGGVQVRNPEGKIVEGQERIDTLKEAYRMQNQNLKTDEEVEQILSIAKAKQEIATDDEKRTKELEALGLQIEAGGLKVAEGKEQKEKAANIKKDMARLVDKLLKNENGVRAFVGPADQMTPTLLPDTLKARTDIQQLKSILTSQNLGIMSGVLSESDIKIIAAIAGGGMDVSGDDEAFLDELRRMRESLIRETQSSGSSSRNIGRFKVIVE